MGTILYDPIVFISPPTYAGYLSTFTTTKPISSHLNSILNSQDYNQGLNSNWIILVFLIHYFPINHRFPP